MVKRCCIVTGASQGYGRCIPQLLAEDGKLFGADDELHIVLMARSKIGLEETKKLVEAKAMKNVNVELIQIDLSKKSEACQTIIEFVSKLDVNYKSVYFFNNAGTIGNISNEIFNFTIEEIDEIYNVNVNVPIFFISKVCKHFYEKASLFMVQTSTIGAVQPLKCLSLYDSTKAAMDMFMKNLSFDYPTIRSLNYAPGPMDTPMGAKVMKDTRDEMTKKLFAEWFEKGTIVNPMASAEKMIKLLKEDKYENGAHLDYYEL